MVVFYMGPVIKSEVGCTENQCIEIGAQDLAGAKGMLMHVYVQHTHTTEFLNQ